MATRRPAKNTQSETAPASGPERGSAENSPGDVDPYELLAELQAGDVIDVRRTSPVTHKGWLAHIDVDPARVHELPEFLQRQYGGGRFLLRWKRRGPDHAGLRFAKGGAEIEIAGRSFHPGEEQNPAPALPFVPVAQTMQAPSPSGTEQHLLGLLTGVIDRVGGDASKVDVVGLVNALQKSLAHPQPSAAQPDAFGMATQILTLMRELQDFSGGLAPRESSSGGGLLGGAGGGLEQMMLAKLMGGDNPLGGPAAAGPNPGPPPSPHHLWHPQAGWVIPGPNHPQPEPPPQPRPQPHPHPPPSADTRAGLERLAGEPAAAAGPQEAAEPDEPMTPEEMAEEIEAMQPDEQKRFIERMAKLYQRTQSNGPAPGGLDLSGTYPLPTPVASSEG